MRREKEKEIEIEREWLKGPAFIQIVRGNRVMKVSCRTLPLQEAGKEHT